MALTIRNLALLIVAALAGEWNKLRLDLLKLKVGTIFHADASTAIATTPLATDYATGWARLNAARTAWNAHLASACSATTGQGAHIAADSANLVAVGTYPNATTNATGKNLGNALKAAINTHLGSTSYHPTADATNTISSTNIGDDDEAGTVAMANEVYTDVNAHIASALASSALNLVAP